MPINNSLHHTGSRWTYNKVKKQDRAVRAFADNAMVKAHREMREQSNVRKTAYSITQADPTNIISVRRGCCRFCWGANHEYQRTDWELNRDLDRYMASRTRGPQFNPMGGGGYVKSKPPNPDCPICAGEGEPFVFIQDFRKLNARDRQLIAGVKLGKAGNVEEIRFHDKIAAVTAFAKIDGMITEKRVVKVVEASDEELNQYFAENPITIDADDPAFAAFAKEVEARDTVPAVIDQRESRLERMRRMREEGMMD